MKASTLGLVFLALVPACSKPKKADQQPSGQVPVPSYPAPGQAPLNLTGGGAQEFISNLLLWQTNAPIAAIQKISDASVADRVKRSQILADQQSLGLPALEAQIPEKQASLTVAQAAAGAYLAGFSKNPAAIKIMTNWLPTGLAALSLGQAPIDKLGDRTPADFGARVASTWDIYCDAKLWELAASSELRANFLERPTPLIMCEPSFAARGLLDPARPECAPASGPEGKSYFQCLWGATGVQKTSLFLARSATLAPTKDPRTGKAIKAGAYKCDDNVTLKTDAIARWVASGTLAGVFQAGYADTHVMSALQSAILNASSLSPADYPAFAKDLTQCAYAFFLQQPTAMTATLLASPAQIVGLVEKEVTATSKLDVIWPLLPKSGDQGNARDVIRYKALVADVSAFASRGNDKSMSDFFFNRPAAGVVWTQVASQDAVLARPAFASFNTLLALPPDVVAAEKAASDDLAALNSTIAGQLIAYGDKESEVILHKEDGATAATDPAATLLLSGFDLVVTSVGGVLQVKVGLAHGVPQYGCVNLAGGSCAPVVADVDKDGHGVLRVSYDGTANLLTMDIDLADPKAAGLVFHPAATELNGIPEGAISGKTLHLEAFGNQLGLLNFFTGNAKIVDGAKTLYEGSISGDAYFDQEKHFR